MKFFSLLVFIAALMIPGAGTGICQEENELLEQVGNGAINWTSGLIRAVGVGAPPEKYYGKPEARPMALRAAKMDAYRNILEVIQGVRIESSTTVKNFMMADDSISAQVSGMVRGAQVAKQEYMSDGTVEVTLEMNLQGGFAQLVLPQDIKQVEPIKSSSASSSAKSNPKSEPTAYTGLVVDARGLDAKPAMSPRVLDENGQEVYGAAFVSREYAVQQGMSGYSKNMDSASKNQRVTANPLIVKAIKTEGPGKTDLVINNTEASSLRGAHENLSFLKQCKVIIVVD
ncbi:MAG: LPP20 family lipoprotein [Pseudomonadota bacterium]